MRRSIQMCSTERLVVILPVNPLSSNEGGEYFSVYISGDRTYFNIC